MLCGRRFYWSKQCDHHRRGDFRQWCRPQVGQYMQRERPPNVLGVGRGDRVFFELEPGGSHVLEGVFSLSALGFIQRIALRLRIDALGEQLARFDCLLSCVRQ